MSLLLEALRKAEKAKEEAQRRARTGGGAATDELRLADVPPPAADIKHVVTRDELPHIDTEPPETLSDDLHAVPPGPAAPELSLEDARPAAAARGSARAGAEPQRERRATARKVFEVKVREPNPRLPFFITVGALGTLALGTVIYFWIQLSPPPLLVNTNVVKPASEVQVAAAPAAPARPAAPAQPVIQGLPSGVAPPRAADPVPPTSRARPATPAIPRDAPPRLLKPAPAPAAAARRAPDAPTLSARRAVIEVHPRVEAGYAAYQSGRMDVARTEYQQALREEPANRDALLGLAAVEMRAQRFDAADALYQRLLHADPRDAHAHAGMLALRSQQLDPVMAESRLKTLLAADPGSGVLHFSLGNQYAQQGRWAEAHQAYIKAAASDPDNPDYAYNLAVGLEHLRQPAPALEQYRRALALALNRNASFDPAAAQSRVQQLAR